MKKTTSCECTQKTVTCVVDVHVVVHTRNHFQQKFNGKFKELRFEATLRKELYGCIT